MAEPNRPLWQWSACELAGAIAARKVTAAEAVGSVVVPVTIKENVDQKGCATPNGVIRAWSTARPSASSPPPSRSRPIV